MKRTHSDGNGSGTSDRDRARALRPQPTSAESRDDAGAELARLSHALRRERRARRWLGLALLVAGLPLAAVAIPAKPSHIFEAGEVISASEVNQNFAELYAAVQALETQAAATAPIREDLTLSVSSSDSDGDFDSIEAALKSLDGRLIGHGVVVTVQLLPGEHAPTAAIAPDHPQGHQIQILGDDEDPAATRVRSPDPNQRLFDLRQGRALGMLSGLTLDCAGASTALAVSQGASVRTRNLIVTGCNGAGVLAANAGTLERVPRVGDHDEFRVIDSQRGIEAHYGASVEVPGALLVGRGDKTNGSAAGVTAYAGGIVTCLGCSATDYDQGFQALYGGVVHAPYSLAQDNHDRGYLAWYNGAIVANGGGARANRTGYAAVSEGVIDAYRVGLGDLQPVRFNCGGSFEASAGGLVHAAESRVTTGCDGTPAPVPSISDREGLLLIGGAEGIPSVTGSGLVSGP